MRAGEARRMEDGGGVRIESPLPGERILFRCPPVMVRAGREGPVEVSIDDGPWRRCEHRMGYWWLRWQFNRPGRHHVVARQRMSRSGPARLSSCWFRILPTVACGH
ncbi:MAG: hypothetical protein HY924_14280 [Elusimicrobia bacterium]|nr:hypothetical protein [Elusimicrobiota bacterium]